MNVRKRAAMVGLGGQATGDHLPGLAQCHLAELAGVCDIDAGRVAAVADAHRVPGFTDVEQLLREVRPDFAIVAVPHHAGQKVVASCAEAGVHVMKEKPFATDPHEAAELATLCDKACIELMVTVQRRFHPVYPAALGLLEQIGAPYLVEGRYTFRCPDPAAGWRGRAKLAGGGCLADMGYHLIDLLVWYLGLPDRVLATVSAAAAPEAEYDAEDTALVHLAYDSGLYGSLLVSRSAGPKTERLAITGPHGTLAVERGAVRLTDPAGQVVESLVREPAWPCPSAVLIDRFCRVLDGSAANPSGPAEHLPHAAFLAAAYASVATNRPADPKEFLA
ncbi:Gfo/Idh/MocA family oxidoreductase [Streptomyces roseoverticillatus]|uniref:Gfo/Idh/MocA family protein n=1 Tax=Streptomyces roseoverticillatus TaxID=66429 RepID=UPI001F41A836|nr:Gfo/Idh/MocA family oxidoreductase [Streptomyces roseoverticillatus]MCF3103182.1 Gfo/Idh/MocA family oxidoreductase [Streptomyces roseoverticillatus]